MTKRRRQDKRPSNRNTVIEFAKDEDHLNKLRNSMSLAFESSKKSVEKLFEKCFFCLEKLTDANDTESHLIPNSMLKRISVEEFDRKKVCVIEVNTSLQTDDPGNFFNSKISTKSALIFSGLCRTCDNAKFKDYENNQSSNLNQNRMREIALKTLLASRYFDLRESIQDRNHIKAVIDEVANSSLFTRRDIENVAFREDPIIRLDKASKLYLANSRSSHTEAIAIQNDSKTFVEIADFEISGEPIVAIQSLFRYGGTFVYVNVFPTAKGNRIVLFRNNSSMSESEATFIGNLSIIIIIAYSIVWFRLSICISPKVSDQFVDGTSIFELLGPRSTNFSSPYDLRKINMKRLSSELGLEDKRMFMMLRDF